MQLNDIQEDLHIGPPDVKASVLKYCYAALFQIFTHLIRTIMVSTILLQQFLKRTCLDIKFTERKNPSQKM